MRDPSAEDITDVLQTLLLFVDLLGRDESKLGLSGQGERRYRRHRERLRANLAADQARGGGRSEVEIVWETFRGDELVRIAERRGPQAVITALLEQADQRVS